MDNVSVSKGVFAYKGSYKIGRRKKRIEQHELFDEPWYCAFKQAWSAIEKAAEKINSNTFKQILSDLKSYVARSVNSTIDDLSCEIPTAILLTGVNLPDHGVLFQKVTSELRDVTPYIAIVPSRDSSNIKAMTEEMVYQLINNTEERNNPKVQKNQCTPRVLNAWYQEICESSTPLVIIVPDFESFAANVLQDFILILSVYSRTIKFVLILGVATTLHAVHRSLSYDVTSKLRVQVFHTQTQIKSLSDVLEGTVLSTETPFKLTGRAFQLLTDIFLFYDFSVDGFLQGYKLCMMQHFYGNNVSALCCRRQDVKKRISDLTQQDIQEIRKLPSVVKYIERLQSNEQSHELSDEKFTKVLGTLIDQFHDRMSVFPIVLRCLHCLTATLPNAPLGKQFRDVYGKAVTSNLTETAEYKESLKFLSFLSKEELLFKLNAVLDIIENSDETVPDDFEMNLKSHVNAIQEASLDRSDVPSDIIDMKKNLSRTQLKEKLLQMSQKHSQSAYKTAQVNLINYLDQQVFSVHLVNPNLVPACEIFCFSDGNAAKHHLRGSLRASIHTALNNPRAYLECDCCKLNNDETILPTMPDLSIIYKLHLESRKFINMYDWLQAFLTIINPNDELEEQREVDAKMQARFSRAVAELQFLGFIKSSRKKTDHVKRLT